MFRNNINTNDELITLSLKSLPALVAKNDLEQIKYIVNIAKNRWPQWVWWRDESKNQTQQALKDAALAGKIDIVTLLLDAGVSPNIESLIVGVVELGNLEMVKALSSKRNSGILSQSILHRALWLAVDHGELAIVEQLLESGYTFIPFEGSILALAAQNDDFRIAQALVRHGASVIDALLYAQEHFKGGTTKEGDLKQLYHCMIKLLLDLAIGIDLGEENSLSLIKEMNVAGMNFVGLSVNGVPVTRAMLKKYNVTGLEQAFFTTNDWQVNLNSVNVTKRNHPRYIALTRLLNKIQSLRGELITDDGVVNVAPLYAAIKASDYAAVVARLSVNTDPDETSSVALMDALSNTKTAEIRTQLMKHLNVDDQDYDGETQLHYAVRKDDLNDIQRLISQGANFFKVNKYGETPLHLAAKHARFSAIKLMITTKESMQTVLKYRAKFYGEYGRKVDAPFLGLCVARFSDEEQRDMLNVLNWFLNKSDEWKLTVDIRELIEISILNGNIPAMNVLLPKLIKEDGWDAGLMHKAVCHSGDSFAEILKILKNNGADINGLDPVDGSLLDKVVNEIIERARYIEPNLPASVKQTVCSDILSYGEARLKALFELGACFADDESKDSLINEFNHSMIRSADNTDTVITLLNKFHVQNSSKKLSRL